MQVEITIPSSLKEVKLKDYQSLLLIDKPNDEDLLKCILNVNSKELGKIKDKDVVYLKGHINKLFDKEHEFIPTFNLNGIAYGFIPSLDDISYGENKDVTSYINDWGNMHKAMAVLFRPIKLKKNNKYIIEEYEGSHKYSETMKQMPLDVVLGAMVFFLQFNQRIAELYTELFGEGSNEGTDARSNFSRKWGSYSELYTLAKGDITRFEQVAKLPLHQCLMYLAFEKEKTELESRMIKSKFK